MHSSFASWRGKSAARTLPLGICLLCAAGNAAAQLAAAPASEAGDARKTESTGLTEIVVTAQKRVENIQDVPIAVTAISGDDLNSRAVRDVQALVQSVPNVTFGNQTGEARIYIRGIGFDSLFGTSGEPRAAYNLDQVYIARSGNVFGTFYDIDRVEVLRGPQGTLFGRNAIAGAVNVTTHDPTRDLQGYFQTDLGNYETVNLEGAVGGPLTDVLSGRIAFQTKDHDGYDNDVTHDVGINNQKTRAIRGKLKLDSIDNLSVVLAADYFEEDDRVGNILVGLANPSATVLGEQFGATVRDGNPRNDYSDTLPRTQRQFWGTSVTANWDLEPTLSLVSITAYRHSQEYINVDLDFSALPLAFDPIDQSGRQITQEMRLQGKYSRGTFVVGAYYFYEDYDATVEAPFDGIVFGAAPGLKDGARYGGESSTDALAGFAEGTYDILDSLTLTAGGRYSYERKHKISEYSQFDLVTPYSHANPISPSAFVAPERNTFDNFTPRVTLAYRPAADTSLYATFAKGFKSGGYNLGFVQSAFNPEKLTDYEIGLKSELLDHTLRANLAGFYYDYKDLQVSRATYLATEIENAAAAKLYGAEIELEYVPYPGLKLDVAGSVMKSKFTEFDTLDPSRPALGILDLSGNRLPYAPKYTWTYGAQYTWSTPLGSLTPRAEARSISQVYFDQFNVSTNGESGYTLMNAFLNWQSPDNRWYGALYLRNAFDALKKNGTLVYSPNLGSPLGGDYDPPRTFGITLGIRF